MPFWSVSWNGRDEPLRSSLEPRRKKKGGDTGDVARSQLSYYLESTETYGVKFPGVGVPKFNDMGG